MERDHGLDAHRQDDRDAVARTDSRIQETLRKASNAAAKLPIAHARSAHLDSRARTEMRNGKIEKFRGVQGEGLRARLGSRIDDVRPCRGHERLLSGILFGACEIRPCI